MTEDSDHIPARTGKKGKKSIPKRANNPTKRATRQRSYRRGQQRKERRRKEQELREQKNKELRAQGEPTAWEAQKAGRNERRNKIWQRKNIWYG